MGTDSKQELIKSIFNLPGLQYYIHPHNCRFFIRKQSDFEQVANIVNTSVFDDIFQFGGMDEMMESDNAVTSKSTKAMKREYTENLWYKLSPEKLVLFLSAITKDFLQDLDKVRKGESFDNGSTELAYENGDIITIAGKYIKINSPNNKTLQEFEDDMVEGILHAKQKLDSINPEWNVEISGIYQQAGELSALKEIRFSKAELDKYAESIDLMKRLSFSKMKELIDKKVLDKEVVFKLISEGALDKDIGLELYVNDSLTEEELVEKIYNKKDLKEILSSEDFTYENKLLLYSASKIDIETLVENVKQYQEKDFDLSETLTKISKYYSNNITKISELLTHNVLDYTNSKLFLDILEKEGKISVEEKDYLNNEVFKFKTDELFNKAINQGKIQLVEINEEEANSDYRPNLNIDPKEAIGYLKSLGTVKRIKVRGEKLLKDSDKNIGKKNSLDGYEMFVIPEKRVVVLEKPYEVTRDKNGEIIYKTDKEGKLIPTINNSTYICPIEMAIDLVEKENKAGLINSHFVKRAYHSMNWVSKIENKITEINNAKNVKIEFDKENTEFWSKRIKENYMKNKGKGEFGD